MKTLIEQAREFYAKSGDLLKVTAEMEISNPEISEDIIDELISDLWNEIQAKKEYKGEQQCDLERGN